ncbi:hypothetical protein MTR67_019302 [Solanum verrucosum]|uniref:Uncharacterized protein n=1 Tax=Solanum verrucosum TaxID=315347 RepID=A0AAF0QLA8_SOLVR|nr:hypothetical protein MTR67_019302 [Solanum verrucosum]
MVGSSTMEALAWEGEGIQGDDPYQIMNFSDRASTSGRTDQRGEEQEPKEMVENDPTMHMVVNVEEREWKIL